MTAEGMLKLQLKRQRTQTTADLSLLCYWFSKGVLFCLGAFQAAVGVGGLKRKKEKGKR